MITLVSICVVAVSLCFISDNGKQQLAKLTDLTLAKIESMANTESGGGGTNSWLQPKTVPCDDRKGDMHTASVERVCVLCVVPYSCTPVSCGEVFYN